MIRNALRARMPRRSDPNQHRTSGERNVGNTANNSNNNNIYRTNPQSSPSRHGFHNNRLGNNASSSSASAIKRSFEPTVESRVISGSYNSALSDQQNGPDSDDDESKTCPVCGLLFAQNSKPSDREDHISSCLTTCQFSGSPDKHRANRMIIYRLSSKEACGLEECVICFEDFAPGDSVGRLECLCVYHEKCILDWFGRKGAGECPVHAVHT